MKKTISIILCIIIVCGFSGFSLGCSSTDDSYKKTLESGQRKYYSGEKMSKEEYEAVKGFNEWKAEQYGKSYNDWDK